MILYIDVISHIFILFSLQAAFSFHFWGRYFWAASLRGAPSVRNKFLTIVSLLIIQARYFIRLASETRRGLHADLRHTEPLPSTSPHGLLIECHAPAVSSRFERVNGYVFTARTTPSLDQKPWSFADIHLFRFILIGWVPKFLGWGYRAWWEVIHCIVAVDYASLAAALSRGLHLKNALILISLLGMWPGGKELHFRLQEVLLRLLMPQK